MKNRSFFIGVILSLISIFQPLLIKTGLVLSSSFVMISLAEKLNAETSTFYFDRGFEKGNKGDYYGAISDFTKALEINSSVGAYYNRGWNKAKLKDYYGAISDYSKAIKINPNKEEAYLNRGFAKHNLNDYYGAVSDYTKAIEINPSYALGFSNRGSSKELIGDMQGACSDWRKASSFGDERAAKWVRNQC